MLSFSGSLRIFIALDPCDMRAGINTLYALVGERLKEDVKNGALFVFTNKRRRLLKVLFWDGTGCSLLTKRLERGTFSSLACHGGSLAPSPIRFPTMWTAISSRMAAGPTPGMGSRSAAETG